MVASLARAAPQLTRNVSPLHAVKGFLKGVLMSSIEFDHNLRMRTETDELLFQPPRECTLIPECVNCIMLVLYAGCALQ